MKTTLDRLPSLLKKNIAPIYLITGDEILLQQEALAAIYEAAKTAGFEERHVLSVTPQFDWRSLHTETAALSLFSEKRLFELRLPTGKPGDAGSKALQAYVASPPQDTLLIITTGKLSAQTAQSNWYKSIDKAGVIVPHWPIEAAQLPQFLHTRLQAKGFSVDPRGITLLADFVQGNLLAAQQEIEKLSLLFPQGELSYDAIASVLTDTARFDVFQFVDHVLQGHHPRIIRTLRGLQLEQTEPALILWALTREWRQLLAYATTPNHTLPYYLEKRKPLYQAALKRHSITQWESFLAYAYQIDRLIKGVAIGNIWNALERLCLQISGAFAHEH